jgi:hypothetical protein
MRDNVVEELFSVFASSDRAEALAGDLAEERQQRGWIWYWLHVLRVTFVLWRSALTEAPLRMLALALSACVLFTAPAFAGVAAVRLFPLLVGSAASWIALSLFWWGGALWTGASLVTISPRRGMATCAIVAVIAAALVIAFGATTEPRELSSPVGRMFFITALGTTVALLAGGAVAGRRTTVIAVPFAVTIGMAASVLFVMAAASSTSAQQNEWRDPSPHKSSLVTVDAGVQLEVLDWGGSGRALLLMHGGGDSAHVFDDIAPVLAPRSASPVLRDAVMEVHPNPPRAMESLASPKTPCASWTPLARRDQSSWATRAPAMRCTCWAPLPQSNRGARIRRLGVRSRRRRRRRAPQSPY